jgi:hypothetical protein
MANGRVISFPNRHDHFGSQEKHAAGHLLFADRRAAKRKLWAKGKRALHEAPPPLQHQGAGSVGTLMLRGPFYCEENPALRTISASDNSPTSSEFKYASHFCIEIIAV